MDAIKNTFFTDILEYCHIFQYKENIPPKNGPSFINSSTNCDIEYIGCNSQNTTLTRKDSPESQKDYEIQSTDISIKNRTDYHSDDDIDSEKDKINPINSDPFLVTWDGEDDPENPFNWSNAKKNWSVFQLIFISWISYTASSIYTPGQVQIEEQLHSSHVVATLNLAMFIFGYGLGPVVFSPLSEVAKVGRQPIYVISHAIFTILQIGCATVNTISGLVIMRFLSGVFCSPALTNGGASIMEMITEKNSFSILSVWSFGTVIAPVTAPLLGAAMTVAVDWRWIFWLLFFLSIAALVPLIFSLPETSHTAILARKARRLRQQTGDNRYYTIQERKDAKVTLKDFLMATCYRPVKMIVQDPIILAFDVYISFVYGVLNLFFEAFPIVFTEIYDFTLIELGCSYLGFSVGAITALAILLICTYKVTNPSRENGTFKPEIFLIPCMYSSWLLPLSLFLFGWGASLHWIVPMISEALFLIACENLFQAMFSYFAEAYPKYVASTYAGNGVMRCTFACAFPLFGKAMYDGLAIEGYPIAWGSSLVGFFTLALATIPFVLYKYGPALRAKSKFAD